MASRSPIAAVKAAARAEKAADRTRAEAEQEWRSAWWVTTMALGAVPASPPSMLIEANDAVTEICGGTRGYASLRRSCGKHYFGLEAETRERLVPRFAIAAAKAKVDPELAADLIIEAEHEDVGLRAFNEMLTMK